MLFVSHTFLNPHHPFSWFRWGSFSGTSECTRSTTTEIGETTCRTGWEGDVGGSGVGCCGCFIPLMNLWSHFFFEIHGLFHENPWNLSTFGVEEDVFHKGFFHLSKKQSSGVDWGCWDVWGRHGICLITLGMICLQTHRVSWGCQQEISKTVQEETTLCK